MPFQHRLTYRLSKQISAGIVLISLSSAILFGILMFQYKELEERRNEELMTNYFTPYETLLDSAIVSITSNERLIHKIASMDPYDRYELTELIQREIFVPILNNKNEIALMKLSMASGFSVTSGNELKYSIDLKEIDSPGLQVVNNSGSYSISKPVTIRSEKGYLGMEIVSAGNPHIPNRWTSFPAKVAIAICMIAFLASAYVLIRKSGTCKKIPTRSICKTAH
ncbi:hypothetical protein [Paenibacillus hamazuiensis]|uniref:hypothetical protein n=1 Tax=Paenibacillus hamazuiensis TaxID=2936508 RepID=UPI0020106F6F|nr:hypothetical protein [Paenibacillus hamazuiensis]